jgi:uncharacterized protein (TIGR02594 family)
MQQTGPAWLDIAKKYLGEAEIKGPHHNPDILRWFKDIGAPFKDDETAWCGAFVGGVLTEAHRPIVIGGASARAWEKLAVHLSKPAVGCVAIRWRKSRNSGLGHVGFVAGVDQHGNIMLLGGNQNDRVTLAPYPLKDTRTGGFVGWRWPGDAPAPHRYNLPIINSDGKFVTSEA